ncbi:DUF4003 family protein [Halobacillus salinus]|uniref:DUF4003 domain-containing protein n=1 Tax=Halobacillus salinus TaxID=192814 RepID=A0A4Z0GWK8_9BACI|nr:DUF4003 family protein [Halobacillus salinus]TGB02031.1 DUF4003 domain-containing protein [Halobacillus salinus]
MSVQEKAQRMIDIFSEMNDKNKWTDDRILMMAASVYVVKNREFDAERYTDLCEYIKQESGAFSYLRSTIRFSVAAWLDTRFDDPREAFQTYNRVYDRMIEKGFKRTTFTYIAALVMLQDDESELDECMDRSLTVYERMRSEHPFITSKDDYPLAVLLAQQEGEIDTLIYRMEEIYSGLNANGFWKGNNLQFISQMLSLDTIHDAETLVNRATHLSDQLKNASLKTKSMHYPEIGMLTLTDETDRLEDIRMIRDQLNGEKKYRWHRDLNYKLAVQLVVSESLQEDSVAEAGLFTSMEVIMQAQQTAIMAGAVGAAAASNGGA